MDRIFGKKGKEAISRIKPQLARHGIPDQLISDNGPPFSSREFQEFTLAYEFEHLTSSPRYAQSNGKVENAVKKAENIMNRRRPNFQEQILICLYWIIGTLQLRG